MATLEQLIIFFLLIGVGVIARKVGVITPGNTPQLTSLVFNFAMPAIILSGITTEQPHISGKDLSIVLTSAFTTLILLIICSRMLARILRYEREYYGVITVMTTFTNVSMMGIPMIYSLYGLGLSIVRAVAIMHRGDAFARSEGGINTFGLTFAMQANKTADNSPSDTESGADKIVREASA